MLSNYCSADVGDFEVIPVPVNVSYVGRSDYRGELYFVPSNPAPSEDEERIELLSWSPNSVQVRTLISGPGRLVINRNWADGWKAQDPYKITTLDGRIAVELEPGTHLLKLVYRPWAFTVGVLISLSTLFLTATLLWISSPIRATGGEKYG